MIDCPTCGKPNEAHFKFCLGCGTELPRAPAPQHDTGKQARIGAAGPRVCPKCGEENDASHHFCASCGQNLKDGGPNPHLAGTEGGPRITALNPDGTEGNTIPLAGSTSVGRRTGGIFASDMFLSPRHATLTPQGAQVVVSDDESLNGVYRRLPADQRVPLSTGQLFRIGQELIRFEHLIQGAADDDGVEHMGAPIDGYVGRIAMVLGRDSSGTAFPVPETGLNLGRERGEVLFADDGYVSGLHCRISYEDGQVFLTDLGSSNGTFIRVQGSESFSDGEVLLMGQQLFRITM